MRIIWHGHACFSIENDLTIVFDPHDGESIGIKKPDVRGDIVLVSHHHFDHDVVDAVRKDDSVVVDSPEEIEVKGVKIKGIESFHDPARGSLRGKNTIYVVEHELTFCHLGDLGHVPSPDTINRIGEVDILFVPVGGTYTIDSREAEKVVELINPKVTVPMHYKIPGLTLSINGVEEFLSGKDVLRLDSNSWEIPDELPTGKIIVFRSP